MKTKIILPVIATSAALFAGCASNNARYVETGGRENIVNVGRINIQDFIQAANDATGKLLASGVLDRVKNPPAVLVLSRIVNSTGQQIETELITQKIRVALLESGKATFTTTMGLGGNAEDPLAKGMQQQNEFMNDSKPQPLPDFSLSGKIIETRASAGNTHQSTFTFQLTLTDPKTGNAVWASEKEITKQGSKASVGF
jgi:uncharacterized protein (TIGR02722 family)